MKHLPLTPPGLSAVAALTAAGVLGLGVTTAASAGPGATTAATAATGLKASVLGAPSTEVTATVTGCPGCRLTAHSWHLRGSKEVLWSSATARVGDDGRVAFRVPTRFTQGLSLAVDAPWEERSGAAGSVVFGYGGRQPGDPVDETQARQARRGSACFAGTGSTRLHLEVEVVRAHFPGNGGTATAAAAYTTTTQRTVGLTQRTYDGFWGTQDAPPCYRS